MFIRQGKTNWKFVLIIFILVAIVGGGILYCYLKSPKYEAPPVKIPTGPEKQVTMTTDKIEYEEKGETIKIVIRNDSEKPIWYVKQDCPPSCCNLYKWENNEWKNIGNPMFCIVVATHPSGEPYPIRIDELKPGESIEERWDMMERPKLAESGKYRFSFYYGLTQDNYAEKTIYSNEFTIKKISLDEITDWKIYKNKGISFKYPPDFEHKGEGQIDFIREDGAPLCSFLTFIPAVDSLENYFQFYADKLGKEIIGKEIKTFGEAKEGILYTIGLTSGYKEMGYIFSHASFTYHFWRDDTHRWTARPESVDLFLKMLSTLKFVESITEISTQEIDNERIYRNEIYGIEFKYPKEWDSLALQSITKDNMDSKIYRFAATGELVSSLYYHQPSEMIAFIAKGEKYNLAYGGGSRQDILRIYQGKEIKTIYTVSPDWVKWYGRIGSINFSPNGKYIYFGMSGYESYDCMMVNVDSGLNITDCNIIRYYPYEDVYWSPNNKVLAIESVHSAFGGEGIGGIFVSEYGNPEKLNEVFSFTPEESISGANVYDIYFSNDKKLFFTVLLKECTYESGCRPEGTTTYEYIVKTKELKEIE